MIKTLLEDIDIHQAEVDISRYLARNYMRDFSAYINPEYQNQWFHDVIDDKLQLVLDGVIKRLMVFLPPQHAKTTHVSNYFPSFALGQNPDLKIIACSYSADLASKINRNVQRIIDKDEYKELFPGTRLNEKNIRNDAHGNYIRNSDEFEIVGHNGFFKGVGVGGPLSGNPADVIIIDDPIKDAMEAQSITDRNRKWEWYCEVVSARLRNTTSIVVLMTRWHEDDLAGRIIAHEPGQWTIVNFPYIKENDQNPDDKRQIGEALWPEMHSYEKAMQLKANSERMFASLCQQRPAPEEGGLFKISWIKYYAKTGLPPRFDSIIQSWDCTFKDAVTSDFVVGQVWGKIGVCTYLLDMVRGRWSFSETIKQMRLLNEKYPKCSAKYVEDKANGTAVIDVLKKEIPGIIPVNPTESKEARATAVSYVMEAGNVYFPSEEPWINDFMNELLVFPNGKHDDMVDSLTQALNKLYKGNIMPGMFTIG